MTLIYRPQTNRAADIDVSCSAFLFHDSLTPELGQHLQHVDADLLRIVVQPRTYYSEAVRRQDAAMQFVYLIPLVLLISVILKNLRQPIGRLYPFISGL